MRDHAHTELFLLAVVEGFVVVIGLLGFEGVLLICFEVSLWGGVVLRLGYLGFLWFFFF